MMEIIIKKASESDMTAVLELIKELAVFEKEPDAVDITTAELIKEGFGESPLFHCFIAEVDEEIVGMALVYFRFSTWKGRSLHLEDLIVTESMRGKGIGEALYTEVIRFAKTEGAQRVQWVVLDWNKPAINFYERTGAIVEDDWKLVDMDKEGMDNYLNSKE